MFTSELDMQTGSDPYLIKMYLVCSHFCENKTDMSQLEAQSQTTVSIVVEQFSSH